MAAHHHAEREERPVRPRDALIHLGRGLEIVLRPQVFPTFAAAASERRRAVRTLRDFRALLLFKARDIRNIAADRGMACAEFFDDVIEVTEQRGDVARTAEETRDAAHAHKPVGVADGLDRVVRFAAEMAMYIRARSVARDHRLCRRLRRIERRRPAAVRHVHDHAELVHFGHSRLSKVAQPAVVRLARAIADRVPAVVGEMHHADAQLVENADVAQFVAHAFPALRERHAVAGEAQPHMPGFFQRGHVGGVHDLRERWLHQVGRLREMREALDEPQRVVPFLACILENARHACCVEGVEKFAALAFVHRAAVHRHRLAQIFDFIARYAILHGLIDRIAIHGKARCKPVRLEYDRRKMQLPRALDLRLRRLQQRERDLARPVDRRIPRRPQLLRLLRAGVDEEPAGKCGERKAFQQCTSCELHGCVTFLCSSWTFAAMRSSTSSAQPAAASYPPSLSTRRLGT